jgi:hypothetical protein
MEKLVTVPRWAPDTKTDWPTNCWSQCDFDFEITDSSSRQRRRYKITNRNCLKENLKQKEKLVAGLKWAPDTMTDRPTDCRS